MSSRFQITALQVVVLLFVGCGAPGVGRPRGDAGGCEASGAGCLCQTSKDCLATDAGAPANATVTCQASQCVITCNMGFADCDKATKNGCEVDTGSSTANCGACGNACAVTNGVASCTHGACGVASCSPGFADCDKMARNGCEIPTSSDAANCGGCGIACKTDNGTSACVMGQCAVASCNKGFADCDMKPENGCELDIGGDVANCGACGKSCPMLANATAACMGGTCVVGMCDPSFADCDKDSKDGCEANLMAPSSCGQCGNLCMPLPNASPACNGGACGLGDCNMLFGDCDGNPMNGCEQSLDSDVNNCGACGQACAFANAKAGCTNGQCGVVSCNQGYADCDGNAANGCEVNLKTDAMNCAACGMACPMNNSCVNGACAAVAQCVRVGWKTGNANWACPMGYRMPTVNEYAAVAPCVTQQDQAMFGYYYDIGVSVGGCNCKWNPNWCGQPSVETMRQGRACGDYQQLQICLSP